MKPVVSVCIPVFNGAPFIAKAIESALAQTFTSFELVVLNNASTDNTAEIVSGYHDPRLRVINNPVNIGAIGNFNKTLSIAQGQYVKILCADDYLYADCLEKQVAAMEAPGNEAVVMVCCSRDIVDEHGAKWLKRGFLARSGRMNGRLAVRRNVRSGANLIGEPSAVLLRSDAVRKEDLFREEFSLCMDLDF
ncbi:glycosyltransferase family 2 protein, partial [Verrucomicrobiota bacterium]